MKGFIEYLIVSIQEVEQELEIDWKAKIKAEKESREYFDLSIYESEPEIECDLILPQLEYYL